MSHYYPAGAEQILSLIGEEDNYMQNISHALEKAMQDVYMDAVGKFYENTASTWSTAESLAYIWAKEFNESEWTHYHVQNLGKELDLDWVDCHAILGHGNEIKKHLEDKNVFWYEKYL